MRLSAPIFRLKRQARLLSRDQQIPLHQALDRIAQNEGFRSWSHLAASASQDGPVAEIFSRLNPGDLMLLGARPGQGKTLLGLELLVEAVNKRRRGYFFTLEYNERDVLMRLQALGMDAQKFNRAFILDTSDDICAKHVIAKLSAAPSGAIAVIDYLQLMDQRRRNPELGEQINALRNFARASGAIIVALSQINRAFELRSDPLPELADVRLPNPLDLSLFTKTCFLHEGEVQLEAVA
jgi:replicative DNA helicase